MLHIVEGVITDHDYAVVLLAAMLCVLGSVSTLIVAGRAVSAARQTLWLVLLGICFGTTAWSTHFIAMLAYKSALPISYDTDLTVLSLLMGVFVASTGFAVALLNREQRHRRRLGGALLGIGVAALHYLGMASLRIPGVLQYDAALLAVSIVASAGLGAAATDRIFDLRRRSAPLTGLLLLTGMIITLHFLGMAAVKVELYSSSAVPDPGVSRRMLVIAVAIASAFVMLVGTVAALVDQQLARQLTTQAERFKTLADGAFEGLVIHQNNTLVDANAAARKLLDLGPDPICHDISDWGLPHYNYPSEDVEFFDELTLAGADGQMFPAELCRRRIRLAEGSWGELIAIRDLTARKQHEERISYLALHDPLTDLPNRRYCTELLDKALENARMTGTGLALFAIDLDNFKLVNDLYGHAGGDILIRAVAERLTLSVARGDVVARLGGDEFALLQISVDSPESAMILAIRVLELLRSPICIDGNDVVSNASIGIALYPVDGTDMDTLMRNADSAMYQAKACGKATFCFFEPYMNAEIEERRRLEYRLRQALNDDALTLLYQPLVDSNDRMPRGFETLLRWTDSELGSVSPSEFIPVAESSGLIVSIGDFVIRRACRDAMRWPAPLRVAVNLSVAQFGRSDLPQTVANALRESGLPGERLELEITESILIDDRENALRVLDQLKSLGVQIAMDDFGTGYSSLSYLQSFAFDKIKIDRSFVSNLGQNPQDAGIVQAVVTMGQSLRMLVVAEGIETVQQADLLESFGCDELQGYLFARPMPIDDVEAYLESLEAARKAA